MTQSQPQQNGAGTAEGTPSAPAEQAANQPPPAGINPTISVQSGFVGLPFLPGTVRVQSIPVEIRTLRTAPSTPRSQNNNNNNVVNPPSNNDSSQNNVQFVQPVAPPTQTSATPPQADTPSSQTATPPSQTGTPQSQTGTPPSQTGSQRVPIISFMPPPPTPAPFAGNDSQPSAPPDSANGQQPQQAPGSGPTTYNFNNPNVEFFMEVTPEGITIDSLETTLVGSNQANDRKCCSFVFLITLGFFS